MDSAFGVDHGEISKGLPSRLKNAKVGELDRLPNGWQTNAMINRKNANFSGRNAGRTGDERAASQGRYYGLRSKNMYRENLTELSKPKRGSKKRELP